MQSIIDLMDGALSELSPPVKLCANAGDYRGERVIYTFNTTFFNGSRREARMKLHIVARTMARGLEIEGMLDELLAPKGDQHLTATAVSGQRNGGGWLEDGDLHIRIAYYDFVLRK